MHEGALGATTNNPFWGRCENPAVPGATPGGSSGGSGAAVAGGLVPIALGTDTMGSVRIPAAYCGVWGIKPTRGLVSSTGLSHLSWTLDTIGPIARSAEDLTIALAVMASRDPDDIDGVDLPAGWTAPPRRLDLRGVILGRPTASRRGRLRTGGARSIRTTCPVCGAGRRFRPACRGRRLAADTSAARGAAGLGGRDRQSHRRRSRHVAEAAFQMNSGPWWTMAATLRGERIAAAYRQMSALRFATLHALATVDALLMPTAPQRAFPHGAPVPANQADLTAIANIAGCPAVAFPLPARDGTPRRRRN